MRWLGGPLRRPVATGALYAALVCLGLAALQGLPLALTPDLDYPALSVTVGWGQSSPEAVEALVTSRIEEEVARLPRVHEIRSSSGVGQGRVDVRFARGTSMERSEVFLRDRLAAIRDELPPEISAPRIDRFVPSEMDRGNFFALRASGPQTAEALRRVLEDRVRPRLLGIEGIADLQIYGGESRELRIDLSPGPLERGDVTPNQVVDAVGDFGKLQSLGFVVQDDYRLPIVVHHPPATPESMRDARLGNPGATPAASSPVVRRLGDVARVTDTWAEPRRLSRVDGEPSVQLIVEREAGTNEIAVARRIHRALDTIRQNLPPGVELDVLFDRSEQIRDELSELARRSAISILAIFGVLVIGLGRVRAPFVVMASVVFSALITFLLFRAFGLGVNVVTLSGLALAFGMAVDNSIVLLENVERRWRRKRSLVWTLAAAREVLFPLLAATFTTAVVLTPFLYMTGDLRDLYLPFVLSVCLSLVASLAVALTLTPRLAHWTLQARNQAPAEVPGLEHGGESLQHAGLPWPSILPWVRGRLLRATHAGLRAGARSYARVLEGSLRRPWIPLSCAVLLFAGSLWVFQTQVSRGAIFPSDPHTNLRVGVAMPSGTEITRTDALIREFEDLVLNHSVYKRGFVEQVEVAVQQNRASLNVRLHPATNGTVVPQFLKEDLTARAAAVSGASITVTGQGPGFSGGSSSVSPAYQLAVRGPDFLRLDRLVEDLGDRLGRHPRVREINTNAGTWGVEDERELVLRPRREEMARLGLTLSDVIDVAQPALASDLASFALPTPQGDLDTRLRIGDGEAVRPEEFLSLAAPMTASAKAGRPGSEVAVPMSAVWDLGERGVQAEIQRVDQQYERLISFDFRGPRRVGNRFVEAIVDGTALPPGYTLEEGMGVFLSRKDRAQIYLALALAFLLIYMVSSALFESLLLPFVALFSVPLSFIGIPVTFWVLDESFDRTAYIGLILLAGIAINNALLLVHRAGALLRKSRNRLYAARRSARERMRPILMTTVTSLAGLLPLAWGAPENSGSWRSLALSGSAGLVASAVFTLWIVPVLFSVLARGASRERRIST